MIKMSLDLQSIMYWLTELNTDYYHSQNGEFLYIKRLTNNNEIINAKLALIDDILYYYIRVAVRASMITNLIAEMSAINAASPILKIYLDIEDEGHPNLVLMHSVLCSEGLSRSQFLLFVQQVEEEALQIVSELKQSEILVVKNTDAKALSLKIFH
ncbi:MAG: hypothetical protein J6562_03690 [Candidatus Schmidhempelia sp.]|nr:hypothetical protein [Candidatus Schmidhempelia sp.]